MRKVHTLTLACLVLAMCGEKEPNFHPELSSVSLPAGSELPYYKGKVMDPYWPQGELPSDLRGLRDFKLTGETGKPFGPRDVQGKYTLVYFFFASCRGICPLLTSNMKVVAEKLAHIPDLQILSITVDPERDNTEALAKYRAVHAIRRPNWFLLTGERSQIESIARDQFAGDVQTRKGLGNLIDFVHTENLYLVDQEGYLRGIYRLRGTGDLDRMFSDLERLRSTQRQVGRSAG